jgi:hypothetical protein
MKLLYANSKIVMKLNVAAITVLVLGGVGASYSLLRAEDHSTRSVWDGVYTFEQAQRGEEFYRQQCMRCHGRFLDGDTLAPPLAGMLFLSAWDGVTLDKLYVRITRDMADNNAGKQNAEINAAMLAYLLAFNDFPSGKTDLPSTAQKLGEIRFDQSRPEKK